MTKEVKIREAIRKIIREFKGSPYGHATLTTRDSGASHSRFTKTGRPPGIMEDETKYMVIGAKGDGEVQYGDDYNTEKEAQAVADRKNNNKKYKKAGISFTVQEKN